MSEQCGQTSKRTSEWPSTYIPILGSTDPLCNMIGLSGLLIVLHPAVFIFPTFSPLSWLLFSSLIRLTILCIILATMPFTFFSFTYSFFSFSFSFPCPPPQKKVFSFFSYSPTLFDFETIMYPFRSRFLPPSLLLLISQLV